MEIESTYRDYWDVVSATVASHARGDGFGTFKSDKSYQSILEHVSPEGAARLLATLRSEFRVSDEAIAAYIEANDAHGFPPKSRIEGWNHWASPSCFRYVYHAHIILAHMKSLPATATTGTDIVEIGGGYGGLALAISHFAPSFGITIGAYHLIDLAPAAALQKAYMAAAAPKSSTNIDFQVYDAEKYGADVPSHDSRPLYLISCYAFGEIRKDYQEAYIKTLFPIVNHGFILYNRQEGTGVTPDDVGRPIRVEQERPLDSYTNKFWWF